MRFTIKRNVRTFIRNYGMRLEAGLIGELESMIEKKLSRAIERAKRNGRTTIKNHDI
ncbi:hypothetical protein KKB44_04065 [Candidatus Micrarchaeota archaeon]|nr:hypothetical protein [Candidatus Micrarchaeota archaeon]